MRHLAIPSLLLAPMMFVPALFVPVLFVPVRQAAATTATPLAAHHAVYALTLDPSKAQDVAEAHGTMTYDVTDTCTAWTTSQHLVIDLTNKDGQDIHMVSDYATLESHDGTHLDFHTREVTEQAVTEQLDGTATLERSGGRGHADFTTPQHTRVLLPEGTLLPMAHTAAVLDAAAAGRKFLSVPLFDGTGADGAQDSFVTVESWHPPQKTDQKWAALAMLPAGRVHIAFFDRTRAAETPEYEIGMRYYANGVADDLAMNFGDFTMDGRLQALDMRPGHC